MLETLLKFGYWADFSLHVGSGHFHTWCHLSWMTRPVVPPDLYRTQLTRRFRGEQKELLAAAGVGVFVVLSTRFRLFLTEEGSKWTRRYR